MMIKRMKPTSEQINIFREVLSKALEVDAYCRHMVKGDVEGHEFHGNQYTTSGGTTDWKAYSKLPPNEKLAVLKDKLANYKSKYVPADKQERAMQGMTEGQKQKWYVTNKQVGRYEGVSRAMANKGWAAKGSEQRKYFHFAIALQDKAIKGAR